MAGTSEPIRTLIVDDEAPARATLRRLLADDPEIEVVGETWGGEAPETIRATSPDLVLLDVQMPGLDGFEVLESLPADAIPFTVFVTAYSEYAVNAFDVRAIDYVLKPFKDERLRAALERAKRAIESGDATGQRRQISKLVRQRPLEPDAGEAAEIGGDAESGSGGDVGSGPDGEATGMDAPPDGRLVLRDGSRLHFIDPDDIDWIEAVGSYVRIHAKDRSPLIRATLTSLDERLRDHGFFRVHRSAVVNLDRVSEARHESHGDYLLLLHDGTRLRLSRTRREAFEEAVGLESRD